MKNTKGITLIALVITIIVLLILAGISISMLSGENSLLSRATQAKDNTVKAQTEEQRKIAVMEAATHLTETEYKGIKIPAGFSPTKINGEDTVDEGLVITDSSGNEYVWIEVPNDGTGPDYTGVEVNNTINTSTIYTALNKYCEKDLNGNSFLGESIFDVWRDSSGKLSSNTNANKNDTEVCGLTSSQYTELYNKMLTSVYKNGGFWIGRYEAGTTTPRLNESDSLEGVKALSKQNLYPINYISCKQAQILASTVVNNKNYNSSLMFDIQWNLVLKFLNNKGVDKSLLQDDSSSWGNYSNVSFIIDRGEYYYKAQRFLAII